MPLLITREIKLMEGSKELASYESRISEELASEEVRKRIDKDLSNDDVLDAFVDGREYTLNVSAAFGYGIKIRYYHKMFLERRVERLRELEKLRQEEATGIEISGVEAAEEEVKQELKQESKMPVAIPMGVNSKVTLGSQNHELLADATCPNCRQKRIVFDQEKQVYTCELCSSTYTVEE